MFCPKLFCWGIYNKHQYSWIENNEKKKKKKKYLDQKLSFYKSFWYILHNACLHQISLYNLDTIVKFTAEHLDNLKILILHLCFRWANFLKNSLESLIVNNMNSKKLLKCFAISICCNWPYCKDLVSSRNILYINNKKKLIYIIW